MDEVEIWMQVLKELNWTFIDEEVSGAFNRLVYCKEGEYLYVYFKLEDSNVKSIYIKRTSYDQIDKSSINKETFYQSNIEKFREVKLKYLTETK